MTAMARLRLPGWIVVGSTGRNSGKTEFACALIRAFQSSYPLMGVKLTTVRDNESSCPRGGAGCGACSTLDGDFSISEENRASRGKDTARMLESGSHRVFWLRCRQQRLREGLEAVVPLLGPNPLVVAESNSLVQVAEPDLFLMVRDTRSHSIKRSAAEGFALADRVILSDGTAFDPSPRCVDVRAGRWLLVDAPAASLSARPSHREAEALGVLPSRGRPSPPQSPTLDASCGERQEGRVSLTKARDPGGDGPWCGRAIP
jgi:hypothetical protein